MKYAQNLPKTRKTRKSILFRFHENSREIGQIFTIFSLFFYLNNLLIGQMKEFPLINGNNNDYLNFSKFW